MIGRTPSHKCPAHRTLQEMRWEHSNAKEKIMRSWFQCVPTSCPERIEYREIEVAIRPNGVQPSESRMSVGHTEMRILVPRQVVVLRLMLAKCPASAPRRRRMKVVDDPWKMRHGQARNAERPLARRRLPDWPGPWKKGFRDAGCWLALTRGLQPVSCVGGCL
jgi:hypothetical protein